MPVFGKSLGDYLKFARTGAILVLIMGVIRFVVGASGVPYGRATHLVSLTILSFLLAVVYGQRAAARGFGGYRRLLPMVFVLSASMYGFIILAILVEGLGGIHGYFHAPGMGVAPPGMDMASHIVGQLLAMVITTLFMWGLASLGFLLAPYLGFLRNAFLLLAAMWVLRLLAGGVGIPYGVGTWLTSLSLLAAVLAVYSGYRAPTRGFTRYSQMVLLGALLAASVTLLVVYGIALTTSLGIANYFHAPGEGFQPEGLSVAQHIRGHLSVFPLALVLTSLLAAGGLALGKKRAPGAVGQPA
jgi:hypothetical protein